MTRDALAHGDECPHIYDASDTWTMSKDGKKRFDTQEYPELLRK